MISEIAGNYESLNYCNCPGNLAPCFRTFECLIVLGLPLVSDVCLPSL